jgi:hypothetical protein
MKPMILFIVVHPIVSAFKQQPQDSCPFRSRVDPKTNMIAYIPDGCRYEVTMGQYLRMMAKYDQGNNTLTYCNFANIIDDVICTDIILCSSVATNPRIS